jgi:hypothetical protein
MIMGGVNKDKLVRKHIVTRVVCGRWFTCPERRRWVGGPREVFISTFFALA